MQQCIWWPSKRPFGVCCAGSLLGLSSGCAGLLLGQQDCLNVGEHTALRNCNSLQQFVQLFVVSDGELQVSWDDSRLLVVSGCIAGQLEDFSSQVFQDSCKVDWRSSTNSLGVVSLADESVNSADWELKSGSARSCLCLGSDLSSLSFSFAAHIGCSLQDLSSCRID